MTLVYAIRYFVVVSVVPPLFLGGFMFAVLLAAIRLASDPSAAVAALTPVLQLQLFAAASGFRLAARRGYYDLLFTSGAARWQIGLAHCLASMMPGLLSWMCVGLLELSASHGQRFTSAAAGTCVAFIAWSLLAWAVAVFSSRTAATVVWLVIVSVPVIARLSPVTWLGVTTADITPVALVGTYVCAGLPFAAALAAVIRGTTPLEAAQ